MAVVVTIAGFCIFAVGFMVAAFSIIRNFLSSSMEISLKGFAVGFAICVPGTIIFTIGLLLGGVEVLSNLGLLGR